MKTKDKRSTFFAFAVTAMLLAASMMMGCKQPSVTVTAYPVSFSAVGGTVTASVDGKAIKNGDLIGVGKEVTFTAHPQSGMQVARWTGIDKSEGKVTITLTVKAGVSVTAECTAIMHTVTFAQPEHGKLTASIDGKDFTGGAVAEGKTVLFKVEPDKGYAVKQWTGAGKEGCTDKTVALTVEKESAVSVEFIDEESLVEKYTVSFTGTLEKGTLSAKVDGADFTGGAVQKGKTVVFTAVPADGYRVKQWTGTDNPASTDKTAVLTVKENATVSVEFESTAVPVQKFEITLTQPTANGSVSAKVDGTPLTFTENKAQVEKGKTVVFTAAPAAGYRVKKWTGTDNPASTDKTAVLTVKENVTVSVEFESAVIPVPKFNVTFDTPQNGTLTASLDGAPFTGGEVEKGKIIIFTAEPAPTYRVRNWMGLENTGAEPIVTFTVTKSVHVSVAFINVPEYTITFSQPANGTLKATLDGVQFNSGDKAAEGKHIVFTAIPEIGYRLLKWENVNTDPEHGYVKVHTVQADKTVSVTFEEDTILTIRQSWREYYVESCKKTAEGKIEVPDYVKYIASNAFKDCVKVTEVTLPAGLTKIESSAFFGCTGLISIPLPAGLTHIGHEAFYGCTGLTSITLPAGLPHIGSSAFSGCTGLTSITIPAGLTHIGHGAFRGCTGLTSITLPAGVTQIEEGAFYGCTGLTSISLPAGVTKIGSSAFYGCTGLTSITLPAGVTKIGSSAFYGCTGLTSISLPAGLTQIGFSAFYGCTGLTSITLPAGLTQIGGRAFSGCAGLTSITIPAGVTEIESDTFSGCTGLKDITIEAVNITEIGNYAFYNIHAESKFKVKSGSNVKQKLIDYGIAESKIEEV